MPGDLLTVREPECSWFYAGGRMNRHELGDVLYVVRYLTWPEVQLLEVLMPDGQVGFNSFSEPMILMYFDILPGTKW